MPNFERNLNIEYGWETGNIRKHYLGNGIMSIFQGYMHGSRNFCQEGSEYSLEVFLFYSLQMGSNGFYTFPRIPRGSNFFQGGGGGGGGVGSKC